MKSSDGTAGKQLAVMEYIVRVTLSGGEVRWLTRPFRYGIRRLSERMNADTFPTGLDALEAIIQAKLSWSEGQLGFEVEEQLRPKHFSPILN